FRGNPDARGCDPSLGGRGRGRGEGRSTAILRRAQRRRDGGCLGDFGQHRRSRMGLRARVAPPCHRLSVTLSAPRDRMSAAALALMDHPNIARVLDAGATPAGRPFFVMELVRGIPITQFCDHSNLSTAERLAVFVPVCHAIHHAHQKGIIHRDLKPSNVLVTLHDGRPVPKVIDFGVAKAISQRLTERTMFTQFGTVIGTLEYMSPEQAEWSGLDIDTRSDVYALGILLYELLTGT